jgi:cardiolipin synthase
MDWASYLYTALSVAELLWVGAAAIYIVLERRSAQATLAWILALAFLPIVGVLVYVFFGPRRFERRKRKRARAADAVGRMTVVDASHALDASDQARHLITMCEAAGGRAARARTASVRLFLDGEAKYAAVLDAIEKARHHVHLEYYIWEPDRIGTRLRDALAARAKAGVEVRVLVDGFGSSKAGDRFWQPLRAAGGEVERFNALTLHRFRPRMSNFRTHRKIVVVDGLVAFTGGMNVSDVHTREMSGDAAWRDTHLGLEGPAAKGLQMVFLEDWHFATGKAPAGEPYLSGPDAAGPGSHIVQVVASGPDENLDAIHKLFFASIAGAHERVLLTTPYFVPDEPVLSALTTAALRGADVRLLVPETGDAPVVAAAARSYYPELVEAGVRVFEYRSSVLHAKTLVVDDDLAVVGTANTDNRSFRLNFEVVAALYQPEHCHALAKAFEADLAGAREVTAKHIERAPFRERLVTASARLLSPIL